MIRRPPRSTLDRSSAASDVYKRQAPGRLGQPDPVAVDGADHAVGDAADGAGVLDVLLSLIHISEPTRPY